MTVEDRAQQMLEEIPNQKPWEGKEELKAKFARHLRDQIEDCAKVIDNKIENWKHAMKTIKHFTGTYEEVELMEEMAEGIRALAAPVESKTEEDSVEDRFKPGGFWYQ